MFEIRSLRNATVTLASLLTTVGGLASCQAPDDPEPRDPASSQAAATKAAGDTCIPPGVSCAGGYCEPDNQGSLTVCRSGFEVHPYELCGEGASACCLPDGR